MIDQFEKIRRNTSKEKHLKSPKQPRLDEISSREEPYGINKKRSIGCTKLIAPRAKDQKLC